MILYNVTVNVENSIHDEWLEWMRTVHVPQVLKTGLFVDNKICRLITEPENDGQTYAFQYICKSMAEYETYREKFAPALQQDVLRRYQNKFVAFRTLLEVIE